MDPTVQHICAAIVVILWIECIVNYSKLGQRTCLIARGKRRQVGSRIHPGATSRQSSSVSNIFYLTSKFSGQCAMPRGGSVLTLWLLLPPFHAKVFVNLVDISSPEFDVAAFAHRVSTEGRLVGKRYENSTCPGVQNKIEEFEYFVVDDELEGQEEGELNIFELVTLMDIVIDTDKIVNKQEQWISAEILIRWAALPPKDAK